MEKVCSTKPFASGPGINDGSTCLVDGVSERGNIENDVVTILVNQVFGRSLWHYSMDRSEPLASISTIYPG